MAKSGTNEESAGAAVAAETEAPKSPNAIPVYRVGMPFFGSTQQFRKNPFQFHLDGYHRYGSIYRTWIEGKNWIVLSGLEANDLIWRNTDMWSYREANSAFAEQLGPGHVTQLDGDPHRKRRQQLKPGFKMEAVMRYLPEMNQVAAGLLPAMCDRPINITDAFAELILMITARTTFRCELSPQMVVTMSHWEHDFIYGTSLRWRRHLYYRRPIYRRMKKEVFAELERILDERLRSSQEPDDNLTAIIKASREAGQAVSRWELINTIYLILLAGIHNTSNLIHWCLLYLSSDPAWAEELRDELTPWDTANFKGMNQFPKLKATIQEVQRLRPGAIIHRLTAARDFEFAGYLVPRGAEIIHVNTLVHSLDSVYEEPFKFNPGRYLGGRTYPPKANGFFGGGTHICLGMNLAMVHTPIILANVIRDYQYRFVSDPTMQVRIGLGQNQIRNQIPAVFTRRGVASGGASD
jgi:cytochrome P450